MEATHPNEVVPIRAQVFDNDVKTLRPLNYHRADSDIKMPTTLSMTAAVMPTATMATITEAALTNSVGSTMKLSADAATFFPNSQIQQRLYNIQHQHQLPPHHYPQQQQQQSSIDSQMKYIKDGIDIGNSEHLQQQQRQQPVQQIPYGSGNSSNSTYVQMQQHPSSAQPLYHQHHYHHHHQHNLQQQHNAAMHMVTNSVQDRLKIHPMESNNHHQQQYQQQHQQQQQSQLNNNNNNNYHNQFHNQAQQYQQYGNANNQHGGYHAGGGGGGFRPQNQGHHFQEQQQQQQQHHNRNQYHQHRSNNMAEQQQQAISVVPPQAAAVAAETTNDMENIALDYLQTVIQCLNQNPGQFDTVASRFITIFDGMENNVFVLSIAMENIFEESIAKPNFRYMGAKLYNLLHMLNTQPDSLFYTLLNCKLNFHQNEVQRYMENNEESKVRETALFLAELYMHLRTEESRIQLIAQNIVYSLKQLMMIENMDNIRCICLTLKLAGYDLTADCPNEMNEIIESLGVINQKSRDKYPMAANVIALQKNNWGRKISGCESPNIEETPNNNRKNHEHELKHVPEIRQQMVSPPVRLSNDPVFYGPDGREITEEECEFLTTNANEADDEDDENAPDSDIDFDLEMEEEHEHDYKEFIKQAKAAS